MAASTSLPHRQVVQARGLLWASDGMANEEIARRCGVDSDTVRRWRSRFTETGTDGVGRIAKGRGRKPSLGPGVVEEVLRLTHKELPADGSTHWTHPHAWPPGSGSARTPSPRSGPITI